MRALKVAVITLTLLTLCAPAFAQVRPVAIEGAWVRVLDGNVTAYFHIFNNAEQADRLVDVSTPVAERARLYRTRVRSGKFSYQPLQSLEIGGFDDERLRPGGTFVRLEGVKQRLVVGDIVTLTLRFERSGYIEVAARVSNQLLGNR
jgi:periplasmic copper chaperone A